LQQLVAKHQQFKALQDEIINKQKLKIISRLFPQSSFFLDVKKKKKNDKSSNRNDSISSIVPKKNELKTPKLWRESSKSLT